MKNVNHLISTIIIKKITQFVFWRSWFVLLGYISQHRFQYDLANASTLEGNFCPVEGDGLRSKRVLLEKKWLKLCFLVKNIDMIHLEASEPK